MSGPDLQYCLGFSLSSSTQEVPFYPWELNAALPWGDEWNDWQGTLGTYRKATAGISNAFVPFTTTVAVEVDDVPGAWIDASGLFQGGPNGPMGAPPFVVGSVGQPGSYQVVWGGAGQNSFPPLSPTNTMTMQMSGPLFYYFGS